MLKNLKFGRYYKNVLKKNLSWTLCRKSRLLLITFNTLKCFLKSQKRKNLSFFWNKKLWKTSCILRKHLMKVIHQTVNTALKTGKKKTICSSEKKHFCDPSKNLRLPIQLNRKMSLLVKIKVQVTSFSISTKSTTRVLFLKVLAWSTGKRKKIPKRLI